MVTRNAMSKRLVRILNEDADIALEFYTTASELVDDFDDYGPMLQADENGEYTDGTAILRLKALRDELVRRLQD